MIQQMLAQKQQATTSAETLASSRKARRLFVGNIPDGLGLTDPQIVQFFNMACRESGIAIMPGDPVVGSWLSQEGKYGFLEFRSIDECTAALALNGISLQGRQLTLKRPNDYEPAPAHIPTAVALVSQGDMSDNRRSATMGSSGLGALMQPGLATGMPSIAGLGSLGGPVAPSVPPSSVLVLSNMVTLDELKDDQDFEEIVLDTKEECEKFGTVVKVSIPRPAEGTNVAGLGKCFVLFDCKEAALKAKDALHGRLFDNRTVTGTFMDEGKFLTGDLDVAEVPPPAPATQF